MKRDSILVFFFSCFFALMISVTSVFAWGDSLGTINTLEKSLKNMDSLKDGAAMGRVLMQRFLSQATPVPGAVQVDAGPSDGGPASGAS